MNNKLTKKERKTANRIFNSITQQQLASASCPQNQSQKSSSKNTKSNRTVSDKLAPTNKTVVNKNKNYIVDRDSITMDFDEFITDITPANSAAFARISSFPVNLGLASVFPRISQTAKLWERYKFVTNPQVYMKPYVSDFNSVGSAGKLLIAADYNVTEAIPSTKSEVEATKPQSDGMACQEIVLTLDRGQLTPDSRGKLVRTGDVPGSADPNSFDAARVYVFQDGITNASNIKASELRIRGRVQFFVPVLETSLTAFPPSYRISTFTFSALAIPSGATFQVINIVPSTYINLSTTVYANTAAIYCPAGNYLVILTTTYSTATPLLIDTTTQVVGDTISLGTTYLGPLSGVVATTTYTDTNATIYPSTGGTGSSILFNVKATTIGAVTYNVAGQVKIISL